MKLLAVPQRATKRDYVDVHALMTLGRMPLPDMIASFRQKFPTGDARSAVRALGYFADVEKLAMHEMLNRTTWEDVKAGLSRALERLDLERALRGRQLDRSR
jgi:hypothetical protein